MTAPNSDATRQLLPRPRTVAALDIAIADERRILDYLVRMATDCLNLDARPLIIVGHHSYRVGPLPIPDRLLEMIADQRIVLARLEHELYDATRRHLDWNVARV